MIRRPPISTLGRSSAASDVYKRQDYEPTFEHYGVPPYIAGFNVSAIAYKTDKWNISRLDNSFQLSGVMMLDSTVDSEAEAERIVRLAEQKFAGNPGQVMFVIRDGGEQNDNSRFIPIASQNEGDWQALHEQAVSDIVVAHSWFRTLSGLDYASGFSAERILHEYEVALNTVILGEQAELTEPCLLYTSPSPTRLRRISYAVFCLKKKKREKRKEQKELLHTQ